MAIDHFKKHSYQKGKVDWNFNVLFNDQPRVSQMVKEYDKLLNHPGLYPPIPTKWLHATILRVGTTDDYTETEMLAIAKKLQPKLSNLKLPKFILGPWWLWSGNPVLHITPESPMVELFKAVLSAIEEVVGSARSPKPSRFIPHVTLAYSRTYEDEQGVHKQLSIRSIPSINFELSKLYLVKQKPIEYYYEWEVIKELPL